MLAYTSSVDSIISEVKVSVLYSLLLSRTDAYNMLVKYLIDLVQHWQQDADHVTSVMHLYPLDMVLAINGLFVIN